MTTLANLKGSVERPQVAFFAVLDQVIDLHMVETACKAV
jgi:hypothetical protein